MPDALKPPRFVETTNPLRFSIDRKTSKSHVAFKLNILKMAESAAPSPNDDTLVKVIVMGSEAQHEDYPEFRLDPGYYYGTGVVIATETALGGKFDFALSINDVIHLAMKGTADTTSNPHDIRVLDRDLVFKID